MKGIDCYTKGTVNFHTLSTIIIIITKDYDPSVASANYLIKLATAFPVDKIHFINSVAAGHRPATVDLSASQHRYSVSQ